MKECSKISIKNNKISLSHKFPVKPKSFPMHDFQKYRLRHFEFLYFIRNHGNRFEKRTEVLTEF